MNRSAMPYPPACRPLALVLVLILALLPVRAEETMLASLDIRDLTMGEFAALLSRSGAMQVVASAKAAREPVSLYLHNVSADEALEAVCRSVGLVSRKTPGGIIHIFTRQEFSDARGLYNDEVVETIQLKYATAADVGETLRNLFADRVVWIQPSSSLGDAEQIIERALNRMDQLADRGQDFGQQDSTETSTDQRNRSRYDDNRRNDRDDSSYPSSSDQAATANLVLMEQSRNLLRQHRPEAGTDSEGAELAESARFGLVFVSAFPSTNMILLRSTDGKALEQIRQAVTALDRPTPQVLLEVRVLEVDIGQGEATGVDWLVEAGDTYGGVSNWAGGSIRGLPAESLGGNLDSAIANQVASATGFGSRTAVLGLLSDHIHARIQLLQTEGRLVQLATPTLLVANDEASRVFIGSRSKFLESVERSARVVADGVDTEGGKLTPNIADQDIGMNLLIAPRIHADRSVTLRVLQEETGFGQEREIDYGEGSVRVQDVVQRSVVSTIVAQDGNWVVIGGLIREGTGAKTSGVPILRSIPVLGAAFRSRGTSRTRSELMILIRPAVLVAPGDEAPVSRALLERISRHPSANREGYPQLGVDLPEELGPTLPRELRDLREGDGK